MESLYSIRKKVDMSDTVVKVIIIAIIVVTIVWGWWIENGPRKID